MEVAEPSEKQGIPYILVHSDREIRRLRHQAGLVNPITRRIFVTAGIKPGMRVLDVGCGGGDVTLLVSELVGAYGHVTGTDRVGAAIEAATQRAREHALDNVSFRQGDPAELDFEEKFDAVVGRYVLLFQADPSAMLAGVARHVRPDGIVAFHEPDWDGIFSRPASGAYDEGCRWIIETFQRTGIETNMGAKLDSTFRKAGLGPPEMHLEAVIGGAKGGDQLAHLTAELVVTMLPEIVSRGVASAALVDVDTLEDRMLRDIAAGSVIAGRAEVGAWARVAGA